VVGLETRGRRPEDLVPLLRVATKSVESGFHARFPDLTLRWTGEIALNYDLRKASAAQARDAERKVLPVTALLLIVAFGAVAAALLPVLAGAVSISLALGGAVILTNFWPLSLLLQNVVAMLGLGLGIDYALLVVGRFREGLLYGMSNSNAAKEAIRKAGHTIALSGASVAIAFSALLIVPVNEIRSIAVGGLLVISVAVLLANVAASNFSDGRADQCRKNPRLPPPQHGALAPVGTVRVRTPSCRVVAGERPRAPPSIRQADEDLPRGDWLPRDMEHRARSDALTCERAESSTLCALSPNLRRKPPGPASRWAAPRRASESWRLIQGFRVRSLTTVTL
jgi:RND superfamily putative drug exporter